MVSGLHTLQHRKIIADGVTELQRFLPCHGPFAFVYGNEREKLPIDSLNGKHGIANIGDEDLEFLVVEVLPPAITAVLPALSPVAEAGR